MQKTFINKLHLLLKINKITSKKNCVGTKHGLTHRQDVDDALASKPQPARTGKEEARLRERTRRAVLPTGTLRARKTTRAIRVCDCSSGTAGCSWAAICAPTCLK